MSDTLVLFLPNGQSPLRWLRVAEGGVAARGEGLPVIDPELDAAPVAVAPADAVTLHWADLPDRSIPQAVAAARLLVGDASASALSELHVAVGRETDGAERPIGVVAAAQMRAWLAALAADGIDPAAVIPAPMLLPRPVEGYVRADLGGDGVVRGANSGFADEARLTELVTGGVAPRVLSRDALESAIAAAVAAPGLDLRQGEFAARDERSTGRWCGGLPGSASRSCRSRWRSAWSRWCGSIAPPRRWRRKPTHWRGRRCAVRRSTTPIANWMNASRGCAARDWASAGRQRR
jgi:general secretion pathway protein L